MEQHRYSEQPGVSRIPGLINNTKNSRNNAKSENNLNITQSKSEEIQALIQNAISLPVINPRNNTQTNMHNNHHVMDTPNKPGSDATPNNNFAKVKKYMNMQNFYRYTMLQNTLSNTLTNTNIKYTIRSIKYNLHEIRDNLHKNSPENLPYYIGQLLHDVYGLGYLLGMDMDFILDKVHESNMSRFCYSEQDAKNSVNYYITPKNNTQDTQYNTHGTQEYCPTAAYQELRYENGTFYRIIDVESGYQLNSIKWKPPCFSLS